MDEIAAAGVSGLVVLDKYESMWRVYFQGRLTAPMFASRSAALGYLAGVRGGSRRPEYARAHMGKEVRG
jgi:hypothetical protein